MAANQTLMDSSSLENLRQLAEFATSPSRTELSDHLPRHLRDCKITDLQKEYASHHKRKGRRSTPEIEKRRNDVHFAEKFEIESSEKGISNENTHSLQDSSTPSSNIQTTQNPSQDKCDGTAHCSEPLVTMGHHVLENIRTMLTKMWIATSDDVLASG